MFSNSKQCTTLKVRTKTDVGNEAFIKLYVVHSTWQHVAQNSTTENLLPRLKVYSDFLIFIFLFILICAAFTCRRTHVYSPYTYF